MNVGQLKKFLEQFPDETPVVTTSSNFELNGSRVDAGARAEKLKKEKRKFRDAFDGGSYSTEIWRYGDGEQLVVEIYG